MFPCVHVTEASAGSGKTYALAMRYLQLVMNPELYSGKESLKTILAITFTNKAAHEMKQRILELLKKIALDSFKDGNEKENIISCLPVKGEKAKNTARNVMEDIISFYNFFQVQTIDSFINALLSGFSFRLGFTSGLSIKDDYRAYLEYGFDAVIDRMRSDKKIRKTFDDFLKYYLFVENKGSWFSKNDILLLMEALYRYMNVYGGEFNKPGIEAEQIRIKKQEIIKCFRQILDIAPEQSDRRFVNSLTSFLNKNRNGFDIAGLSAYFKREEFPMRKNSDVPENASELWSSLRGNLKQLCEMESRAVFSPYIEIFGMVREEFKKLSGIDDVIFLPELNTYARNIVDDEDVKIEEIYCRIATRLLHYLIDEFQDTGRLQWENILPMIDEALSSGGSLFYAGDKKQAIYRFRGGDVSLFDSVQDSFKNFNPERIVLSMNYRSQKEIVEFNNMIFSNDNLVRFMGDESFKKKSVEFTGSDIRGVLNVFSDSEQRWKEENKDGYFRAERIDGGSQEERNFIVKDKLTALIDELKSRFTFEDIAILARTNSEVKLLTSWLLEKRIPVESEKTLNVRGHPLIKELISFLKFLNSPIDNISFASFIFGDIFLKASGIKRETVQEFLFKLKNAGGREKNVYVYREFRTEFNEAWSGYVEEFFKSAGFVPVYELIISILGKFRVMENFGGYQGFFMKLLEFIKENEENYSGISSFLEFIENAEEKNLYVNVTSTGSVKISTIHNAKGLEFPVVIIPFLEMDVTVGSGAGGSKKSYVVKQCPDGSLDLVRLRKEYCFYSEKLSGEYRSEYVKSLIDELDIFYVAMTRAMYEMYLFIPENAGSGKNIAAVLMPFENHDRGRKKKYEVKKSGEAAQVRELPVSHYTNWIEILKDEFMDISQLINRDRVLKGDIFHCILSCVGNLRTGSAESYMDSARSKAGLLFPYVKDIDEYISTVRRMLEDEKLRPFFYIKEGTLYQEKEIVDHSGNVKRIDRLIITSEEALIVDYKSSKDESGAHRKQVLEYMDLVRSIYPELTVKGFLIYMDTFVLEEVR